MAATEDTLGLLHEAVAQELLKKLQSGDIAPAELSTAVKFLKDNGIEAKPTENSTLVKLAKELPDFGDEEPLHAH